LQITSIVTAQRFADGYDAQRFAVGYDSQRFAVGILTVFSVSLVKIRISASLGNYRLESGF
jgi:hypothetical protein